MTLAENKRLSNALAEIRVKCPCSHTLYFPAYAPDIQICNHCGQKVYRNEKVKFKDLISRELKIKGGVIHG